VSHLTPDLGKFTTTLSLACQTYIKMLGLESGNSSLTGLNPRGGINGCLSNSLCTQLDSATANQSNEEGDVLSAAS